jgi:hypothetical protein
MDSSPTPPPSVADDVAPLPVLAEADATVVTPNNTDGATIVATEVQVIPAPATPAGVVSFVTLKTETEDMFLCVNCSPAGLVENPWKWFFVLLAPHHSHAAVYTHKCIAKLAHGGMCGKFVKVQFTIPKSNFQKRNFKGAKAVQHLKTLCHRGSDAYKAVADGKAVEASAGAIISPACFALRDLCFVLWLVCLFLYCEFYIHTHDNLKQTKTGI